LPPFHLQLLQATLPIALYLSAAVFLSTRFKYCSPGLPKTFSPNIAPSRMFTTNSLCLIVCRIHEWRLFSLQTWIQSVDIKAVVLKY
jgi:hypothetical protein